jgi:hypothetical protein
VKPTLSSKAGVASHGELHRLEHVVSDGQADCLTHMAAGRLSKTRVNMSQMNHSATRPSRLNAVPAVHRRQDAQRVMQSMAVLKSQWPGQP